MTRHVKRGRQREDPLACLTPEARSHTPRRQKSPSGDECAPEGRNATVAAKSAEPTRASLLCPADVLVCLQRGAVVGEALLGHDNVGAGVQRHEAVGGQCLLLGSVQGLHLVVVVLDRDDLGELGVEVGAAKVREVRRRVGAVDLRPVPDRRGRGDPAEEADVPRAAGERGGELRRGLGVLVDLDAGCRPWRSSRRRRERSQRPRGSSLPQRYARRQW